MNYKYFGIKEASQSVVRKRDMIKNMFKGIFDKVIQRSKIDKINNLFTYVKFVKNVWYVIIVLAGVFFVIRVIRQYHLKKLKNIHDKRIEERKRAFQVEQDLKNTMLMDHLLTHIYEFKDKEIVRETKASFKLNKDKLLSPLNEDDTTNHCSCLNEDEECAAWYNGNISEISYWNDVIYNNSGLPNQKSKEYLNLGNQNLGSWSVYDDILEQMKLQKTIKNFNKIYNSKKNICMTENLKGKQLG